MECVSLCAINFCMGYTACERLIQGDRDMIEVEKVIVRQLGGESHWCAFFRSVPYIRLQIAALYLPSSTPHVAYCGGLSITLTPTEAGPVVSVNCSHNPIYPEDFQAASQPPPCRKRMRTGESVYLF